MAAMTLAPAVTDVVLPPNSRLKVSPPHTGAHAVQCWGLDSTGLQYPQQLAQDNFQMRDSTLQVFPKHLLD